VVGAHAIVVLGGTDRDSFVATYDHAWVHLPQRNH
jgi:hypothetical protein